MRVLLTINDSSVEQFCKFINVKKDERHADLETISATIRSI